MADVLFGTSGSTGASKPIMRTEESLMRDAKALVDAFHELWSDRPAVVATIRPEHMYGALWRVRAPQIAGCVVDDSVVLSVEELCAACSRHGGRVLFVTTPSFLEKALTHPDFAGLKGCFAAIVTSGSLLRSETSLAVAEVTGVCPLEIFGSTETGTVAYRRRVDGEEWTVFPGIAASLSQDGRIVVDSPFAMERPYVMSDAVRFTDDGRFLLLGRTDRRVKILEKYVSLGEVESAIEAHHFVSRVRLETYGESVQRLGALVVLSEDGRATLAVSSYADLSARLRRDLLPSIGELGFPRRIRFVRELPVNEQGKTTAAASRAMLLQWCQEPVVMEWNRVGDSLKAKLVFVSDAECFKGHFPGYPILPGVAQLYFLRHFARQAFADYPDAATYRRLKFQKLIRPGREISLEIARRGDGAFGFSLAADNGPCASGIVERTEQ